MGLRRKSTTETCCCESMGNRHQVASQIRNSKKLWIYVMKMKESKEHEAIQTTKPLPYIQGPGTHHTQSEMADDEGGKYGE